MNFYTRLGLVTGLLCGSAAYGSGFALYEPSTLTHAFGGAVLGKAMDASANFWNPATLSDLTNATVSVGTVIEVPYADVKVNGHASSAMDPGCFLLPHFQMAVPLPWDFTFGLGVMPEYGLGSKYKEGWEMNWSSYETTVQGITTSPNLSYRITDDWSIGGGFRVLFFDFEQYSHPLAGSYGNFSNRLKGSNRWADWGWQVGTRYKVTDDFAVGLVYKSAIDVRVKGRTRTEVKDCVNNALVRRQLETAAAAANGNADCNLELPQSVAGGFNWDVIDTVHVGGAVTWTEWSSIDTLVFELPTGDKNIQMGWNNTWRFSGGVAWDFVDDWTVLGSYIFDEDCTGSQTSTMLPPANRHCLTGGLAWRCWRGLEVAVSYGVILMDGGAMFVTQNGREYRMEAHHGISHAAGVTLTYRF